MIEDLIAASQTREAAGVDLSDWKRMAKRMEGIPSTSAETVVLAQCRLAGIVCHIEDEVRYGTSIESSGGMTIFYPEPRPIPTGNRIAYVPRWVAYFFEGTFPRSRWQECVLHRAQRDEEWRNAGITIWMLGGIGALERWLGAVHEPRLCPR